ncbi:hypothetical protein BDV93DRAFT_516330 [Ceratobasidium sp. AG-I]|nr:hypothetical protein BDV93DRAFT_516330 [Ceratobasidium sp. AG-I]
MSLGSSGSSGALTGPSNELDQATKDKTEAVFSLMAGFNKYSFGDLLSASLRSTSQLNKSCQGAKPPDADKRASMRLFNSREGIEEWIGNGALYLVNREAKSLMAELALSRKPTWEKLKSFSLEAEGQKMISKAPLIYAILSVIASVKRRKNRTQGTTSPSAKDSSSGDENAPKLLYRVLRRMKISPAHSTVLTYLKELAISAKEKFRHIGRRSHETTQADSEDEPEVFMLGFDSINKYVEPRNETVGNKSKLRSGTAATALILEDVPKGAFDRKPYAANMEAGLRRNLTLSELYQDIDQDHLAKIGTASIMRILSRDIQALKGLKGAVRKRFSDPTFCAVHRLSLRKTRIHTMGTSGINEATAEGVSEVLDDLVLQMDMKPTWFDELLILVCGDQLTVDRLRKAIRYLAQESSVYAQKSWVLPLIQPWHMSFAYLRTLMGTHWYEATGKDTLGLRRSVGVLGRRINAEKCDYYTCLNAVTIVFNGMVLSAARAVLRQRNGTLSQQDTGAKSLQLLEELEGYFSCDGPLENCTLEQLESLSCASYQEFFTTEAYQLALSASTNSQPLASEIDHLLTRNMEALASESNISASSSKASLARRRNAPVATGSTQSLLDGDDVLANGKLFMRDALFLIEFTSAMDEGDPGCMFKIMDIFRFSFWGANATNYGSELLEMACNFKYEYPDKLQQAIKNNYVVNPSGLPGHWQAVDLLQEHHNKDIKNVFNSKNSDFNDPFLRESVSLNIAGFAFVKNSILKLLGLARTGKHHSAAKYQHDLNVLGAHFEAENFFTLTRGRSQPYQAQDMIALGYSRLDNGVLKGFLERTLHDPTAVVEEGNPTEATGDNWFVQDAENILHSPVSDTNV